MGRKFMVQFRREKGLQQGRYYGFRVTRVTILKNGVYACRVDLGCVICIDRLTVR